MWPLNHVRCYIISSNLWSQSFCQENGSCLQSMKKKSVSGINAKFYVGSLWFKNMKEFLENARPKGFLIVFLSSIWKVHNFQTNYWFLLEVSHNNASNHRLLQTANTSMSLAHLSQKNPKKRLDRCNNNFARRCLKVLQ